MAWEAISNTVPQYSRNASGDAASDYYLKGYTYGSDVPINMASDASGNGQLVMCQVNSEGYFLNGSGAIFTPHFNQNYRIALYEDGADAIANDLNSAVWVRDFKLPASVDYVDSAVAGGGGSGSGSTSSALNIVSEGASTSNTGAQNYAVVQPLLDAGENIYIPKGTYEFNNALILKSESQFIVGDGKYASIIRNTASATIISFGDASNIVQRAKISDLGIEGGGGTTAAIVLPGILDDSQVGDASKANFIENVRVRDAAGDALRVSSWSNTVSHFEAWDCGRGIRLGSECNACTFINPYITGCTNEAVYAPNGAGIPSNITFLGGVYQRSGGTNGTIWIEEGNSVVFMSPYTEGNTAPYSIYFDSLAHNCTAYNVMHNTVGISPSTHVICYNTGKGNRFEGVQLLGGTVQHMVRIQGVLPTTVISNLHASVGTVTSSLVDDESDRLATTVLDPLDGSTFGPSRIYALQSVTGWRYTESDTGNDKFSIRNGIFYVGDRNGGSNPGLTAAGTTLRITDNAGTSAGNVAYATARIGDWNDNVKDQAGTGSPEGAVTADVGSTYRRTDGGAGTSFYVKETGTGSTGWVAK